MNAHRSNLVFLFILGLIAAAAVRVLLYSTPEGLSLSDDSIAYIAGARSILAGKGYREAWLASNGPVTHFPPGFSSVLALVGLSGLDPLRGTRFVNSLLFGANAFLLGVIGWRMTKSQSAGVVLAVLFAVNASLLRAHAAAMSEPLYIFFSLAAFLAFSRYFSLKDEGRIWLVLTACLTAFAYLTRYAGLALLATFIAALILLHDDWRRRLTDAGVFLASALPWMLAWSVRNKLVADSATNRTLVYHPLTAENIQLGLYNFSEFFIPLEEWRKALIQIPNFFPILLSALAVGLLTWIGTRGLQKFLRPETKRPEILSFTNGLYFFVYLASIVASMMLFDASTKFRLRILAPVYVSLLVLLVFAGMWLWNRRARVWRAIVILLGVFVISLSVYETAAVVADLHKGGQGYASFKWYDSEAMAFLRELPEGIRIYTNQPGAVYLYTGRPTYVLPDTIDPVTGLPRPAYDEGVARLRESVLSGKAVLALFKVGAEGEDIHSRYMRLSEGLFLAHKSAGDEIYVAP
jgi:4-amino-4-deoxy-L-arabinose transferase-like glycosyltransferase